MKSPVLRNDLLKYVTTFIFTAMIVLFLDLKASLIIAERLG